MAFITTKSIISNNSSFYIGTNTYNVTSVPSNETKITASDGALGDEFGRSVAVGSGRIVVGAPQEDPGGISNAGSAYIFDLNGNELAKITASDAAADDYFGRSVAVGSGRIVVGADLDNHNSLTDAGAAYIFDIDGNQLKKITASDAAASDFFGYSVAVGSGRIVVGAFRDNHNSLTDAGSAYIFDLDGNQLAKITASDAAANDYFGYSVAVGSGRIVIGAQNEDPGGITNAGAAYIFDLDGNELKKITASDRAALDYFGSSVAVGSGRIVVGASYEDPDGITAAGSAYIFDLDGNQLAKITASDAAASDFFGNSVAVSSGRIVVGAEFEDPGGLDAAGSAYIFDLDGNQLAKIIASDVAASMRFGYSVAAGSGKIVIGAYFDDDNGSGSGSAYIYDTPYQIHYLDQLDKR